jgi:hypothetical protein
MMHFSTCLMVFDVFTVSVLDFKCWFCFATFFSSCVLLSVQFEDCTFEWRYWPQAHVPFEASTLKYIASLDAEQDIALLKEHGWSLRSTCARVFRISTMLLKKGAAAGLTPVAIGSMMCRKSFDKKSPIELMLEEAEEEMLPASNEQFFMTALAKVMDSYIKKAK